MDLEAELISISVVTDEATGRVSFSDVPQRILPALVDTYGKQAVANAITAPHPELGFRANLHIVNDEAHADVTESQLLDLMPAGSHQWGLFVVDRTTLGHPEHPVLVLDALAPGRSFRVVPSAMWGVENNLSLANMDFEELAECTDPDGIFRGFE